MDDLSPAGDSAERTRPDREKGGSGHRRMTPERGTFLFPPLNLAAAVLGLVGVVLYRLFGPEQFELFVVAAAVLLVGVFAFASGILLRRRLLQTLRWQEIRAQRRHVQLEDQAMRDDLTKLPNRRYFNARLSEELELARDYRRHLAVLALDVDGFKEINDTYGHHVGDVVLANVGKLLAVGVRTSDVATRIGGDEFAVIMPDTNKDGAFVVAHRLQESMDGALVFDEGGLQLHLRVSIGVSGYPWAGDSADAILRRADTQMYAAKMARKEAAAAR